ESDRNAGFRGLDQIRVPLSIVSVLLGRRDPLVGTAVGKVRRGTRLHGFVRACRFGAGQGRHCKYEQNDDGSTRRGQSRWNETSAGFSAAPAIRHRLLLFVSRLSRLLSTPNGGRQTRWRKLEGMT